MKRNVNSLLSRTNYLVFILKAMLFGTSNGLCA
jgi:hypothetical protein